MNISVFDELLLRVMGAEIGEIVYGIRAPEKSKEYILMAEGAIDILNESRVPGAFWADFLPFVRYIPSWVPGAKSSQFAKHTRPKIIAMKDRPFDAVKIDVVSRIVHFSDGQDECADLRHIIGRRERNELHRSRHHQEYQIVRRCNCSV